MAAPEVLVGDAHAKVNLGLGLTGVRPDGYHELSSVFLRIALVDTLAVTMAGAGRADRLVVDDPACPVAGNLVLRAVAALRARADGRGRTALPGLLVSLAKRIPMGAGLAGGSTDAATALRLGGAAWDLPVAPEDLHAVAAGLGADVPFFVGGAGAALVTGIGENVTPLPDLRSRIGVLLLSPSFGLATPEVFRTRDRLPAPDGAAAAAVASLATAWMRGLDGPALAGHAVRLRDANDLWAAATAIEPRLDALRESLERTLARPVLLTGSGSTLYALYPSPEAALDAVDAARAASVPPGVTVRVTASRDSPTEDEAPTR